MSLRFLVFAQGLALLAPCAVAQQQPPPREETPAAPRSWDDFPVFVWRQERGPLVLDPRWQHAFGATNLGRSDDPAPLGELGLPFYVDNAAGRDELHLDRDREYEARWERWYRTRDDALLVREPCLNDPAVRGRMLAALERTLERTRGALRLGISLGDEVSWTPYGSPEDTCLCAACRLAWRAFLERAVAEGRTDLDPGLALERASTDLAREGLEKRDGRAIHAWLLRREFTQSVLLARLEELAARSRELEPRVPIGLLGMIGRTAFGGVSLERVLPRLDFAECYRVGDARELLFTLRGDGQRVVQTLFHDAGSPAAPTWFAWEAWMRGTDGFVIWSDRELARHPGYGEGLARAVGRIRELREELPDFAPRPIGVAVVHDEASIAYGWLSDARLDGPTWPRRLQGWQEERGSRERSLRAWFRVLEDCGAMPGALPLEEVGAASVSRFPLLVLNHLRVLDPSGLERLEAYLSGGGRLLVRGELGVLDGRGKPAERSILERLRAAHPGAVQELGPELEGYLEERIGGGNALRERIASSLKLAGAPTAPWRMRVDPQVPWLSTWCVQADGSLLCAALPNLAEASEREQRIESSPGVRHPRLYAVTARVEPPEGFEIRWSHPRDARGSTCELPAGEAAVFRLVRTRVK